MSRQVEPSDTVSPWRAAKPRRPLKDFPGTPNPGAHSPHYQEPSPPNSSNKESTRLESGLRTTPPARSDVRAELEAQGASPVFPEESAKRGKVQANVPSSDYFTKLRSSRTLRKRGEARSDSEEGEEEQPAARCQFVGNSSSHSRSSSALERSRRSLEKTAAGGPSTGGPSTKAGGPGGALFWLALLAGAAVLWSGIYLQQGGLSPGQHLADSSLSAAHWREMRSLVREELRGLKLLFPNQTTSSFWTIVSAALKAPMHSLPDYPGVLLLLSSPSSLPTANCLASSLAALSSRVLGRPALPRPPPSSLVIQCGALPPLPTTAKEELTALLHAALSSGGAVALLDLHLLHPDPALTLHAFTDNSNAPYKQAVVVATLLVPPSEGCKNLEQRAERALTEWWGALGADKLAALLSRVVVSVGEVQAEGAPPCT